jgi:hypothetical protein
MHMRLVMSKMSCPLVARHASSIAFIKNPSQDTLPDVSTQSEENLTVEECTYANEYEDGREHPVIWETNLPASHEGVWYGDTTLPNVQQVLPCPDYIPAPIVLESTHKQSGHRFRFRAPLLRVADAPRTNGFAQWPHAYYEVTDDYTRPVLSPDGAHVLRYARLRIACITWRRQTPWGVVLEQGSLYTMGATGRVYPNYSGGGGNDYSGWGHNDPWTGTRTGAGVGWETAVHNWVVHRICTAGWDIYEDGAPACSAEQVD